MKLQGDKIYLQENLSEENYPLLLKWLTDLDIVNFLYFAKRMMEFKTVEDLKDFLFEEKDELIGYTSLCSFQGKEKCEFSIFILNKNYWGKGIGMEASKLLLDYAFNELKIKTITLETSEFHQNAISLYEKIGFKKVKLIPNDREVFFDGKWISSGTVEMEKDVSIG